MKQARGLDEVITARSTSSFIHSLHGTAVPESRLEDVNTFYSGMISLGEEDEKMPPDLIAGL